MAGPVDELVDEVLALRRDGRVPPLHRVEAELGAIEFCGEEARATLTFVRHEKITLLAVGTLEETVEFFEEKQRDRGRSPQFAWAATAKPAGTVWCGELRGFRPLGSGRVLGVIEREKAALVLGLVGRNCVVILVEARRRTVLCVSPWEQLGVVDVDTYLQLVARKRPAMQVGTQEASDRDAALCHFLAPEAPMPPRSTFGGTASAASSATLKLALTP